MKTQKANIVKEANETFIEFIKFALEAVWIISLIVTPVILIVYLSSEISYWFLLLFIPYAYYFFLLNAFYGREK